MGLPQGGRGEAGTAAGVAGPGAPGAQQNWQLGPQERGFSSLWQLCLSGDTAWRWHSCSDHWDPGNAEYKGAVVTGDTVLLGLFLASGSSSAPVRIQHGGGTAARIVRTLELRVCRDPSCLSRGSSGPLRVSFSPLAAAVRAPLWPVLLYCSRLPPPLRQ